MNILTILADTLSQLGNSFSSVNPAITEILKIFAVSCGWIGGLTLFMWWKERKKQTIAI